MIGIKWLRLPTSSLQYLLVRYHSDSAPAGILWMSREHCRSVEQKQLAISTPEVAAVLWRPRKPLKRALQYREGVTVYLVYLVVVTRIRVFTDQLVLNGEKLFRSSLSSWRASIDLSFAAGQPVHVLDARAHGLIISPYQARRGSCSAQSLIGSSCAVSPVMSAQLNCQELQLNMPLTSLWKTAKARSRPGSQGEDQSHS